VEALEDVFRLIRPQGDDGVIAFLPPRDIDGAGVDRLGGEIAGFLALVES